MRNHSFVNGLRLTVLVLCLLGMEVRAGEIVPFYDDAAAVYTVTAAQMGSPGDAPVIAGSGTITFAARFTATEADLSAAGPVIILECGGTTFGNGLYIAGGNLVFAMKGVSGSGGNFNTQASLNDTDAGDNAAAVTIGPVTAGVDTRAYASLNTETGELITCINGLVKVFTISGTSKGANLSGDESVSFLGLGVINAGQLGGLTNTNQGQDPLWDAREAVNFSGSTGRRLGQIFEDTVPPALMPHDPNPADGAVAIDPATLTQLTFAPAGDPADFASPNPEVTGHFVTVFYVSDGEPNFLEPPLQETFAAAGDDPAAVDVTFAPQLGDVVYWRVEEQVSGRSQGDPNNIIGPLWSFEMLPASPAITAGPADQLVSPAETAVFSCEGLSKIPVISLEWYRAGDPENPISDTDPDVTIAWSQEGADFASTLTIANAEAADEDAFTCRIVNEAGTTNSDPARLGVKRPVAYWPLDGDYLDISGENHHAHPNVAPDPSQWVAGVDPTETGQGLDLLVQPLAAADAGSWEPAEMTGQMTMSIWGYWTGPSSEYQGLITKRTQETDGNVTSWTWQINRGYTLDFGGPGITNVGTSLSGLENQWIHFAVTVSPEATVLYVNGRAVDSGAGSSLTASSATIKIGANNTKDGVPTPPFAGTLDEARIYNYAMSPAEVAMLYYDVLETSVCLDLNNESLRFDLTDDCRVDLADFAALASHWMQCGLYPVEECPYQGM